MINDKHIVRLVGWTVCLLAGASVLAAIYQAVVQHHKVDSELHDLVILLAGGILTAFRTGHTPGEGDAPIPVEAQNTAANPVPTADVAAPIPADSPLHPDTATVPADL